MKNRKIRGVRAMCEVQLKYRKIFTDLMCRLTLSEAIGKLAMANSVHWYGHELSREGGHALRRALDFEVEHQRKKGRMKRIWKKQVAEECMKFGLRREDALCLSMWSVGIDQIATGLR